LKFLAVIYPATKNNCIGGRAIARVSCSYFVVKLEMRFSNPCDHGPNIAQNQKIRIDVAYVSVGVLFLGFLYFCSVYSSSTLIPLVGSFEQ